MNHERTPGAGAIGMFLLGLGCLLLAMFMALGIGLGGGDSLTDLAPALIAAIAAVIIIGMSIWYRIAAANLALAIVVGSSLIVIGTVWYAGSERGFNLGTSIVIAIGMATLLALHLRIRQRV